MNADQNNLQSHRCEPSRTREPLFLSSSPRPHCTSILVTFGVRRIPPGKFSNLGLFSRTRTVWPERARPRAIDKPATAKEGKKRRSRHEEKILTSTNDDDIKLKGSWSWMRHNSKRGVYARSVACWAGGKRRIKGKLLYYEK